MKEAEVEAVEDVEPPFLDGHLGAMGEGGFKIRLDGGDDGVIHEHTGVLKVEGQGAVVQIDGAHHGLTVVGQKHLRVDEAGGEAQDRDAVFDQLGEIGFAQVVDDLLVGDGGHHQPHAMRRATFSPVRSLPMSCSMHSRVLPLGTLLTLRGTSTSSPVEMKR